MNRESSREITSHDKKINEKELSPPNNQAPKPTTQAKQRSMSIDSTCSQGEAGSQTYPTKISTIKVGGLCMLKGFPCKVTETFKSKCGKHGHAKLLIIGKDIFTQKKYEDVGPVTHNIDVPVVQKTWYDLLNMDKDG
jgi:hypothetical protein